MKTFTFKKILCETALTGSPIHIKHKEEPICSQAFADSRCNGGQTGLDDSLFLALLLSSSEHWQFLEPHSICGR